MSVTDEIKDRIDIVDLISESVELRRSGKTYSGFCPFHANTRTPSFVVFPDSQSWHCFGECNEGGDVFNFVMKKNGWDFPEALRRLAERTGVQLKPLTPQQEEEQEEHEHLRKLLEDAVTFYRHNLYNTEPGKIALEYLYGRKLTDETIEAFGLGYAPNSWDAATTYFKSKNYTEEELLEAGLASERDGGGIYDRFRQRMMIPIRDHRERMVGFGARTLEPDGVPKYLNSPQTALFDKSSILYGLDKARKAIRAEDQVVIVEGYMGVIAPHQHGFTNVVATMGTALTDDHLQRLQRYTKRIILAMDSDAAGAKAALRGLQVAREALDKTTDLVFDARGLLRREARIRADLRVATLPPGMDPDDVVNHNPEELRQILANARPVVVHVMEVLTEGRNLEDPKTKTEIASQVLPLINDIPNAIERDTYLQRLARTLEVDERTLFSFRPPRASRPRRKGAPRPSSLPPEEQTAHPHSSKRSGDIYEAHCVGILLRHPELLYQIDRQLGVDGLARLTEKDFYNADYQVLVKLAREALDQNETEPISYVLNNLPMIFMDLVDELLTHTTELDAVVDKVLEDVLRALLSLRRRHVLSNNSHLRYMLESEQENGDYKATEYQTIIIKNLADLQKIDKAMKRYTSRTAALEMR
ncbi:MAG: DNA primase [Chloroflexota bacterium]|nr:MAG: DNA primase [Chloroflexota bacterium]